MPKKAMSKKVYIAIFLLVILVGIAVAAIVYTTQTSSKSIVPGVNVGDTFTYKLTGVSQLYSLDANPDSEQPGFDGLNNTAYTITITGINGTIVSYNTNVILTNGTSSKASGWVNMSSGNPGGDAGFWGIYPANLAIGDLVNPGNIGGPTVANAGNQTYSNSYREVDYFSVAQNATRVTDPTGNTQKQEITSVYFDQPTGMLTNLQDTNEYNNPEMTLIVTWQLVYTSVWTV
jgi:hypothetical protein